MSSDNNEKDLPNHQEVEPDQDPKVETVEAMRKRLRALDAVLELDPSLVLRNSKLCESEEDYEKKIREAVETDPSLVLQHPDTYKDKPYYEAMVRESVEIDPFNGLNFSDTYKEQPWAEEVIQAILKKSSISIFRYAHKFDDQPWAKEMILSAAEIDPEEALKYVRSYKPPWSEEVTRAAKIRSLHLV